MYEKEYLLRAQLKKILFDRIKAFKHMLSAPTPAGLKGYAETQIQKHEEILSWLDTLK